MYNLATVVGPSALALKDLKIDHQGTDDLFVRIVGRKSGLMDFLLSMAKIDATTVFEVYRDHIKFSEANLSGKTTTVLPLSAVSSTSSGFFKPVLYLIVALFFLIGLSSAFGLNGFLGGMVLAVILFIYYSLHKSLLVTATSHSSISAAIAFKSSVIEGVKIGPELADEIIQIINQLVLHQQSK